MDDLEQDVGLLYRAMGRNGIESIEGVGAAMGGEIESLLQAEPIWIVAAGFSLRSRRRLKPAATTYADH